METWIKTLLTCSAVMSITVLLLLPVLVSLKRYSWRARYLMLLVVLIGFVIPFRPAIQLISVGAGPAVGTVFSDFFNQELTLAAQEMPLNYETDDISKPGRPISLLVLLGIVWTGGAVLMLIGTFLRHVQFIKIVRHWSEPVDQEWIHSMMGELEEALEISRPVVIRVCPCMPTPLLTGMIQPQILLPHLHYSREALYFILKHELVHLKQGDLLHRLLLMLARILHWFNPVVYLLTAWVEAVCEMACDEEVVRKGPSEIRFQYTETILRAVPHRKQMTTVFSTHFYGGKKIMKRRISEIMDSREKKAGGILVCVVLAASLGISSVMASATEQRNGKSAVSAVSVETAEGGTAQRKPFYMAVQDDLQFVIENIKREENLLLLEASLTDLTGNRLRYAEDRMDEIGSDLLVQLKPGVSEEWLMITGSQVSGFDKDTQTMGLTIYAEGDGLKTGDSAVLRIEGFVFQDVLYEGVWELHLPVPETGWIRSKYFDLGTVAGYAGLDLTEAYLMFRPDGSAALSAIVDDPGSYDSAEGSVELYFANDISRTLMPLEVSSSYIDPEENQKAQAVYQYVEDRGHAGKYTLMIELKLEQNLTKEQVDTLSRVRIGGLDFTA